MDVLTRAFWRWLPLGIAISMLCGVAYVFSQQVYRMSANDPQIQMAEDAARAIADGARPLTETGPTHVDPSASLAPFLIVTDSSGRVVASSALLGATAPTPPAGVLQAAKVSGEDRVTWQPRADARIAAVVVPISGGARGYVLAGRSLRAVEEREDALLELMWAGWAATIVVTLIATWAVTRYVTPPAAVSGDSA